MNVELIDPSSALWSNSLKLCEHDVYHTPGWIKASMNIDKGEALAVLVENDGNLALFPFLKREIDGVLWDATSAYGYGGPVFGRGAPARWEKEALEVAVSKLREEGCVSWFVRLHPLLNVELEPSLGDVVVHGPTVSIDLKKSEEQHWKETRSGHKGDIKKSVKAGITVDNGKSPAQIDAFVKIYKTTMMALGAASYYSFERQYFDELISHLQDDLILLMAREGDEYIGGSMFTVNRFSGLMQYHLSGTAPNFRHRQPSKIILHSARAWGRENDMSRLHLGGGLGAKEDALYKFKAGFSPDTHSFRSLRIVVNDSEYARLSNLNDKAATDNGEFFPVYRA